jgi:hypothetical protein
MDDGFGLWDVFVSMLWFGLLMTWIWMIIAILGDIFRDHDLSGGKKALWTAFIVLIPWLGALCYIFARGDSMNKRAHQAELDQQGRLPHPTWPRSCEDSPSSATAGSSPRPSTRPPRPRSWRETVRRLVPAPSVIRAGAAPAEPHDGAGYCSAAVRRIVLSRYRWTLDRIRHSSSVSSRDRAR